MEKETKQLYPTINRFFDYTNFFKSANATSDTYIFNNSILHYKGDIWLMSARFFRPENPRGPINMNSEVPYMWKHGWNGIPSDTYTGIYLIEFLGSRTRIKLLSQISIPSEKEGKEVHEDARLFKHGDDFYVYTMASISRENCRNRITRMKFFKITITNQNTMTLSDEVMVPYDDNMNCDPRHIKNLCWFGQDDKTKNNLWVDFYGGDVKIYAQTFVEPIKIFEKMVAYSDKISSFSGTTPMIPWSPDNPEEWEGYSNIRIGVAHYRYTSNNHFDKFRDLFNQKMNLNGNIGYHPDVYSMVIIVVGLKYDHFAIIGCRMEYSMPFVVIDESDGIKVPLSFPVGIDYGGTHLVISFGSGDASTKVIAFDPSNLQLFTKDTLVLHPHQTCFLKGSSRKGELIPQE